MKAKLSTTYRWNSVTLDGREYIKTEFRQVTPEIVERHAAILDVQMDEAESAKKVETPVKLEPKAEVKPEPKVEPVISEPAPADASVSSEPIATFERQSRKNRDR